MLRSGIRRSSAPARSRMGLKSEAGCRAPTNLYTLRRCSRYWFSQIWSMPESCLRENHQNQSEPSVIMTSRQAAVTCSASCGWCCA